MALSLLGPEDPVLQRVEDNTEAHLRDHSLQPAHKLSERMAAARHPSGLSIPVDVLLLNRMGTPAAILVFLRTYSSWDNFHWECLALCMGALLLNVSAFWLLRHNYAVGVLLRLGFWRRVLQCLVLPSLASGCLFLVMEGSGNAAWLHGFWHLALSALAVLLIQRVLRGDSVGFGYDDLQRNPVVAHHILWAAPALGGLATVVSCPMSHDSSGLDWRLSVISSVAATAPGNYVLLIVSMVTAVAAAATWRIIDLVSAFSEEQCWNYSSPLGAAGLCSRGSQGSVLSTDEGHGLASAARPSRPTLRKSAIFLGYVAVCSALVGASCSVVPLSLDVEPKTFLVGFFALHTAAIVLVTVSANGQKTAWTSVAGLRMGVASALGLAELGFLAMSTHRSSQLEGMFSALRTLHNTLGPVILALHLVWPLTWFGEAEEALIFWVHWYRVQPHVGG